jgi:hypothetical protein
MLGRDGNPLGGLLLLTDRFEDRFASSSPRASSKSTHSGNWPAPIASLDYEGTCCVIS